MLITSLLGLKSMDMMTLLQSQLSQSSVSNDTTTAAATAVKSYVYVAQLVCRLNQDTLDTLRKTLQGLKLLITDEISMMSSTTILFIYTRLTEIMANSQFFGGISVILFGNFLQLPPVKGNQPFVQVTQLEAKQCIGSVAALDLWSIFRYEELTINIRQKGDDRYAALLSNIRVGKLTDEDEQLLRQRLISNNMPATITDICDKYSELNANGESPIILVPRSSQCTDINTAILRTLNNDIIDLPAIDTLDTIVDLCRTFIEPT